MTFHYSPAYEKLINFSTSLRMAFESDKIAVDQLPESEGHRAVTEDAFASLVKVMQPYRNELAALLYHDPARLSLFTEWRLRDLKEKKQSATIDTMLDYIENMELEEWALSTLRRYGSPSLSAESFYYELLRNPPLLISYIQSLDVPDAVKLGIIRVTTATESVKKVFMRFLQLYRAVFEEVYPRFSEWAEARTAELEATLPDQLFINAEPFSVSNHADSIHDVYYGSLFFQPLGANDIYMDDSLFIAIGLAADIFDQPKQIEQLEATKSFKYLDEPKHIAILRALLGGELCVMDILTSIKEEYTIPQPTLSGYLQDLFDMGAVKRHYEDVKCYYEIDPSYITKGKAYFDVLDRLLKKGRDNQNHA